MGVGNVFPDPILKHLTKTKFRGLKPGPQREFWKYNAIYEASVTW